MSDQQQLTLTPSDLVFLHGDEFAKRKLMGNVNLVHVDAKVSAQDLGCAVLSAGFLGAERAGAITLEVRPRKAWFGLRTVDELWSKPTGAAVALPEDSLEARIARVSTETRKPNTGALVNSVVYALIGEDSAGPWGEFFGRFQATLVKRGVLRAVSEKKLKIITVTHYELPDETAAALLGAPVEPVKAMLADAEQGRPAMWKLMQSAIKLAIASRTEQGEPGD